LVLLFFVGGRRTHLVDYRGAGRLCAEPALDLHTYSILT
jgi:hypothetical protein